MTKFISGLNFILAFLIFGSIESANVQFPTNGCLECNTALDNCKSTTDSILANDHDRSLVSSRTPGVPIDRQLTDCLPDQYNLTGEVDETICFPSPRCKIVVNRRKYRPHLLTGGESLVCAECAKHCGCPIPTTMKEIFGGAQRILDVSLLKWIVIIVTFTFVRS